MPRDMETDAVLAALVRALRSLGWQWRFIYRYTGLGHERADRLRREYNIEPRRHGLTLNASPPPPLGWSYPCWASEDDYDDWFVTHDAASPFRR